MQVGLGPMQVGLGTIQTMGSQGSGGHCCPNWSSCRQKLHRGMARARPMNASLCNRVSVTDQLRSLRARASLRNWWS